MCRGEPGRLQRGLPVVEQRRHLVAGIAVLRTGQAAARDVVGRRIEREGDRAEAADHECRGWWGGAAARRSRPRGAPPPRPCRTAAPPPGSPAPPRAARPARVRAAWSRPAASCLTRTTPPSRASWPPTQRSTDSASASIRSTRSRIASPAAVRARTPPSARRIRRTPSAACIVARRRPHGGLRHVQLPGRRRQAAGCGRSRGRSGDRPSAASVANARMHEGFAKPLVTTRSRTAHRGWVRRRFRS